MRDMSAPVQFEYELPSGDVIEVNALVIAGSLAYSPGPIYAGTPAEDPEIEITDCFFRSANAYDPDLPFDPEGLWVRRRDRSFRSILDELEERALAAYYDR